MKILAPAFLLATLFSFPALTMEDDCFNYPDLNEDSESPNSSCELCQKDESSEEEQDGWDSDEEEHNSPINPESDDYWRIEDQCFEGQKRKFHEKGKMKYFEPNPKQKRPERVSQTKLDNSDTVHPHRLHGENYRAESRKTKVPQPKGQSRSKCQHSNMSRSGPNIELNVALLVTTYAQTFGSRHK